MKKLLRRFAILMCLMTLLIVPSTAYAASTPVLVSSTPTAKFFQFQPGPYYLAGGGTSYLFLRDTSTSNQDFVVPANVSASFCCDFDTNCRFQAMVVDITSGKTVSNQTLTGTYFLYTLPTKSVDTRYRIIIGAQTDCWINDYSIGW